MGRLSKVCLAVFALALFVIVTEAALPSQTTAKVLSVDADRQQFVVQPTDGKTLNYDMDEDAQVFINDKEASLHELRPGDRVTVVDRQNGDQWMAIEVRCNRNQK